MSLRTDLSLRTDAGAPAMPGWVRLVVLTAGIGALFAAAWFAAPLADDGWAWKRGLVVVFLGALGLDLLVAAARRRLPLSFFLPLF